MKTFPIGTKVFDIRYGWGEVIAIDSTKCYPIEAKFKDGNMKYSLDGKQFTTNLNPILSLTEYTLEKGGFTPITEFGKPKVGDWGYFWDEKNQAPRYGMITSILGDEYRYMLNFDDGFKHFSHEIPQEYIDYVNNLNK